MYCPLCTIALQPVERLGMEIDHCPNCGGVWMDPGELDELIRREATAALREGHEQLVRSRRNRPFDTQTFSTAVNPPVLLLE